MASVILPVLAHGTSSEILFIRRAADGYHHSRQISFPGGRLEPGEDPLQCALREFEEEMGAAVPQDSVAGLVDIGFAHVSCSRINCYLAVVEEPLTFAPNPREVEYIIRVPLNFFLYLDTVPVEYFEHGSECIISPVFQYRSERIWGATARMMATFLTEVNNTIEEKHV